ncbi:MAG: shikimate kinase [Lachnospirales bacterium]
MKLALIGENIEYSLSPKIHNIFFEDLGIKDTYDIVNIPKENFDKFMSKDIYEYNGINVTIPYKQEVLKYLDVVSDTAQTLNSVNTICVVGGKLYGYNTDIIGFSNMMDFEEISFYNKDVVILGTGATASMVEFYAIKRKAKSIVFVSRKKIEDTNDKIYKTYDEDFQGDILINTTPCGVLGKDESSPISEDVAKKFKVLVDVNYSLFRNKFLQYGIFNNKKVISGLYMLVSQGIEAEKLFGNVSDTKKKAREIYIKMMKEKNIVVIGLTGAGKSTISKVLAKSLNKCFYDLDKIIISNENKSIEELFQISEEYFRKCESENLYKILNEKNAIISTGGGVILKEENMYEIYKNSIVIEIKRDVKDIVSTISLRNRPQLVGDTEEKLKDIYEHRKKLYKKYAEYSFKNFEIKNTVKTIIYSIKGL